ncbi:MULTISPECIES: hypothetical protein [unclassified Pseudomonas]|uniref:hypothetical protein n=1 Tax=unclassified Pseudomonas TaxID=196821 RepID=UPI001475B071|nr:MULTISPECIES: hypothetical protein [unclassified Pseudomonas]NMX94733.1 hypothetical protein [Pseudomonas sp. WS 5086]NMY45346.1 hypothetical protein [Pseudomonas sp. WS 5027]
MKRDWVIWGGCFLLFVTGSIFGAPFAAGSSNLAGSIEKIMSFFASIATIVAAGMAFLALNQWKKTFRHTARFEAIKLFRSAVPELSVALDYYESAIVQTRMPIFGWEIDQENDARFKRSLWLVACLDMSRKYEDMLLFMSPKEIEDAKYTPAGLEALLSRLVLVGGVKKALFRGKNKKNEDPMEVDRIRQYLDGLHKEAKVLLRTTA